MQCLVAQRVADRKAMLLLYSHCASVNKTCSTVMLTSNGRDVNLARIPPEPTLHYHNLGVFSVLPPHLHLPCKIQASHHAFPWPSSGLQRLFFPHHGIPDEILQDASAFCKIRVLGGASENDWWSHEAFPHAVAAATTVNCDQTERQDPVGICVLWRCMLQK